MLPRHLQAGQPLNLNTMNNDNNKNKWSIVINAILTAISTIVGAFFLSSCVAFA